MPGPIMTFGPTQRQPGPAPARDQAAALRTQPSSSPFGGTGQRAGGGTLAADYYGGVNAITGQRFGPSRAMPTDPRERAAIEARRRATQQALFGGRF